MHYSLTVEGEELWLLPDKAVYWPARRCLLIADAHFGKASAYRSLGQPVPQGTTTANLERLDRLVSALPCAQLIFLGDFLHGPGSHASGTLNAIRAWRVRNRTLTLTLIRGNHDKSAGDPPLDLGIEVIPGPLLMGPFALQHEPDAHASHHVLAGHVHPVYHLRGKGRQRLRLPCFQIGTQVSLLPAFGAFTGGYAVEQAQDQRIFVIGDHQVWPIQ
ncbi:ligase-associated DNA damage response endonuclease PdeM [Pseudomonas carnis]|uniref:ligase-associated DNA damage response endonuclease PdeM n=1 Tax=Pseudomonas carnis TaxID=2487355 RepID=UPI0018E5C199|nr:ligase-associated DNA damage response endonuclease PdeM [Pseudomonas carnis]MBI6658996.1 ligase-associated DNA damage response endonuclease PdeM [Pseudomonas carnis]MBI6660356.1 ligase-associated DNA damage response endonuclease PdeM [Pseudomonas carnis]MBI6688259.1 ligase-associated DNA damage response endonuclease PdeM [Pseudomonas carnis]